MDMTTVKLFGVLRDKVKSSEVSIPADRTIRQILGRLAKIYGPAVGDLLLEKKDGELKKRYPVIILINGISQVDLDRVIGDNETVSIFPAIAGGCEIGFCCLSTREGF